ncbi:hypothetical protein ACQKWADRAFT_294427 [Trichoderma austrokoningii]
MAVAVEMGALVRRGHDQPESTQPRRLTSRGTAVNYQLVAPASHHGCGKQRGNGPLASCFCRPSRRERRDMRRGGLL